MNEQKFVIKLVTGEVDETIDINPLNNVIGQDEARQQLTFFAQSHSVQIPFPTMLFNGSHGLGKTYMSHKVAETLGREMIEVNSRCFETTKDFIEGFLFKDLLGETYKTVLLDESHKLTTDITTILLSLLDPKESNVNLLSYKNWLIEFDFSKINFIFATTDAHKMFSPLVNRCEDIYFESYSDEDIWDILKMYTPNLKIECDRDDIINACRGRARDTFRLSKKVVGHCAIKKTDTLTQDGWLSLKKIFGIKKEGLLTKEVNLLRVLADHSPISGNNLATKLGVNVFNVEKELETRAREPGYIESGSRGHYITEQGNAYLKGLVA